MFEVTISFDSPLGKGSGTVTWRSVVEVDVVGYNVLTLTAQGDYLRLNDALIPCIGCVTGLGYEYSLILPKHKSGRNIFIEEIRFGAPPTLYGPARRE